MQEKWVNILWWSYYCCNIIILKKINLKNKLFDVKNLFDPTYFIVWNIKVLQYQVAKILNIICDHCTTSLVIYHDDVGLQIKENSYARSPMVHVSPQISMMSLCWDIYQMSLLKQKLDRKLNFDLNTWAEIGIAAFLILDEKQHIISNRGVKSISTWGRRNMK